MIALPDTTLPADVVPVAYAALLAAIAVHEPAALARVAVALEEEAPRGAFTRGTLPAPAVLARAWLALSGQEDDLAGEEGETLYVFTYPAHLTFDLVGKVGKQSALRRARNAVAALRSSDVPLVAVPGPLAADPDLLNVTVWLGSPTGSADQLELEWSRPARRAG
jgi:hypothetical protein